MNPITSIFQVISLHLKSPWFKVDLKGKNHNFEIEWMLCCSKYIVLIFSCYSLYVELIDGQSFTKQRGIVWLTLFAFEWEW